MLAVKKRRFFMKLYERTFTSVITNSKITPNSGSNIASLHSIPSAKPEFKHQLVHDSSHIMTGPVGINRWTARERESRKRWNYQVIGQGARLILVTKQRK